MWQFLLFWFTCGAIAARAQYIYYWNAFPTLRDRPSPAKRKRELLMRSVVAFLGGPWALLAHFTSLSPKHGIFFHSKPPKTTPANDYIDAGGKLFHKSVLSKPAVQRSARPTQTSGQADRASSNAYYDNPALIDRACDNEPARSSHTCHDSYYTSSSHSHHDCGSSYSDSGSSGGYD